MIWLEFEYNKPYHHMNTQQRLRYEYEPEIDIDDFNLQEYLEDFTEQQKVAEVIGWDNN